MSGLLVLTGAKGFDFQEQNKSDARTHTTTKRNSHHSSTQSNPVTKAKSTIKYVLYDLLQTCVKTGAGNADETC